MARIEFDGKGHCITLFDKNNKLVGQWEAYNNVDRGYVKNEHGLAHLPNKTYVMINRSAPKKHPESNHWGAYGPYGIFQFKVDNHPGIGVHSGRAIPYRVAGPPHATDGCIRTTDDAMKAIVDLAKSDHIETISVYNNSTQHANSTESIIASVKALLGQDSSSRLTPKTN
jgi:hypothetical protein